MLDYQPKAADLQYAVWAQPTSESLSGEQTHLLAIRGGIETPEGREFAAKCGFTAVEATLTSSL